MRIYARRMLAILTVLALLAAPALAEAREGVIRADSKVNLRTGPGTDYDKAGKLSPGDRVTILGEENGWYRVRAGNVEGYVRSDLVMPLADETAPADEPALEAKCENAETPLSLKKNSGFTVKCDVSSNVPLVGLFATVRDERAMAVEAEKSRSFSRSENVTSFALSLSFDGLTPGEKRIEIRARSASGESVLLSRRFSVLGEAREIAHITKSCEISASCGKGALLDGKYNTIWTPKSAKDVVTVTLPEGSNAAYLFLAWQGATSNGVVAQKSASGELLSETRMDGGQPMYEWCLPIDAGARTLEIRVESARANLSELRVYAGELSPSAHVWQTAAEKADILFVSAHQDDEMLFFGGSIPWSVSEGKNVLMAYMADCGRDRYAEALDGLWTVGLRTHPVFFGQKDKLVHTLNEAETVWDKEATIKELVTLIRRYKPEVVLTHDFDGEYGHGQHKMTAACVKEAVKRASDETKDPDSYALYGAWDVKKLYAHLYADGSITMDWNQPLDAFDGRTALQMATAGYDKHVSQQGYFTMAADGKKYDNRKFGLVYTSVGEDAQKNSFFENIP